MRTNIFIDANIIIDLLTNREPFASEAALLFEFVKAKKVTAFTSANCITNIHYVLSSVSKQRNVREKVADARKLLDLVATDADIVDKALTSDFADFEDAIQYYSAISCDADYIVTRNPSDYRKSTIRIVNAEEMNRIIEGSSG